MGSWRARADRFPGALARALVQQALTEEVLTGWAARDALAARGDDLAARDLLTRWDRQWSRLSSRSTASTRRTASSMAAPPAQRADRGS